MDDETAWPKYEIWAGQCIDDDDGHSWEEIRKSGDPVPIKAICSRCGRQGFIAVEYPP